MRAVLAAFPFLLILLISCSGSPPGIVNTDWMIVYSNDLAREAVYTELNFFAQLDDPDGAEDISDLSIHRDDLGWAWNLNTENWMSYSSEGEYWLGSNGLTMGGTVPDGEYRLLVVDRSGQRNETVFRVNKQALNHKDIQFPSLEILQEKLWLNTAGREAVALWFYDNKGELVAEKYSTSGLYKMEDLLTEQEIQLAAWIMIYYQDEIEGYGLKSGPYVIDSPGFD